MLMSTICCHAAAIFVIYFATPDDAAAASFITAVERRVAFHTVVYSALKSQFIRDKD